MHILVCCPFTQDPHAPQLIVVGKHLCPPPLPELELGVGDGVPCAANELKCGTLNVTVGAEHEMAVQFPVEFSLHTWPLLITVFASVVNASKKYNVAGQLFVKASVMFADLFRFRSADELMEIMLVLMNTFLLILLTAFETFAIVIEPSGSEIRSKNGDELLMSI